LHVWLAAVRLRFDQAELLVVLGDGAGWIASLVQWLPCRQKVLHILDFYHAAHRVWEVARAIHGDGTDLCRKRARMWCEVVEQGHVRYLVDELRNWRDPRPAVQEEIDELAGYFANNQARMDYPAYRARAARHQRQGRERQLPRHRRAPQMPGHALGRTGSGTHGAPARGPLQRTMGRTHATRARRRLNGGAVVSPSARPTARNRARPRRTGFRSLAWSWYWPELTSWPRNGAWS
jgi:hypothetical protein